MITQLIRDGAIYGAAGILGRATLVLLLPVYTRLLSSADIGALDLLSILISVANVTVALEVSQGFARYYPEASDPAERVGYSSTAFWFTVVMYTAFAVVGLLLAPVVAEALLGSVGYGAAVRLAVISAWLAGIFLIVLSQLRFGNRPWSYVVVSLTQTALSVVLSIGLVVGARLGLAGVYIGQIMAFLVAAGLAIALTRGSHRTRPDTAKLRAMLTFSLPLVPSSVGVFVTQSIDRLSINALMGLADVGLFGVGYRVAQSVSLIMIGVQLALTPLIYSRYREDATPGELARIFRYFVALALLICCGLSFLAPYLIRLLATAQYDAAASVIPLLGPALLLSSMYVFAPGLSIAKRTGAIALLNLGGAVLNTVLNLLLIPPLGINGAALATLISAATVFGGYMVFSQRAYPVPHHWIPLAAAAAMGAAAVGVEHLASSLGPLGFLVGVGVLVLVAAALVRLGLVRGDELRSGWRRLRRLSAA